MQQKRMYSESFLTPRTFFLVLHIIMELLHTLRTAQTGRTPLQAAPGRTSLYISSTKTPYLQREARSWQLMLAGVVLQPVSAL